MDKIRGTKSRGIDANTFEMDVSWQDPINTYKYNPTEKIQLSEDPSPEPGPPGGVYITNALLLNVGDRVHCNIQARDVYGRVVADVWNY